MNEEQVVIKQDTEFKKEIGLFGGVSILGGIMIGGGIFYLGSIALLRTGFSPGLALLCWVIAGLVSMLGGLCFAELGAMIPKAGGMTVYLSKAFHPLAGFLYGFNLWLVGGPASLGAGALALVAMFGLGDITGKIIATAVIVIFTVYNCFGVKMGAVLQNITMVAKLIPIVLILVAALVMGDVTPNLSMQPMDGPAGIGQILSMIAFATVATLWAYEGWTNLNAVAEEMKNVKRNLPLSLILSIGGITLLYALFNYSVFKVIPLAEIRTMVDSGNLYLGTEAAIRTLGGIGGSVVSAGMIVSMLGSINGMTMAFPRNYYAMAEEGHFFKSFKKLHPKYKVPTAAIVAQGVITLVLIWTMNLNQLTSLVVFTSLLFNTLAFAAVLIFRKTMPNLERPYRVWGGVVTVLLAIIINIGLMANTLIADTRTSLIGLIVPVIGSLVFWYFDVQLKKERQTL